MVNKIRYGIICFLLINLPFSLHSQTKIKMNYEKGHYTIPCKINSLNLRCIYDPNTPSLVSLSDAIFMLRNGYLNGKDVLENKEDATLPYKTLKENTEIIIREVEIEGLKMYNVKAIVVQDMIVPLILGQAAIEQVGFAHTYGGELIITHQSTAYQQYVYQQPTQRNINQSQHQNKSQYTPQTIVAYTDDEVELAFNNNIQCDADNPDMCTVWIRREYFGKHKDKYIRSFTTSNHMYLKEQQAAIKTNAARHHIDYTDFKYNWALYVFDFSRQRYKMIHLAQYNWDNTIIQKDDTSNATWTKVKPGSRMEVMFDTIYSYYQRYR